MINKTCDPEEYRSCYKMKHINIDMRKNLINKRNET